MLQEILCKAWLCSHTGNYIPKCSYYIENTGKEKTHTDIQEWSEMQRKFPFVYKIEAFHFRRKGTIMNLSENRILKFYVI